MGTSVHVFAPGQIALHDASANAGPIVLNGGNLGLSGPLSTLSGTILAISTGPIQLNAPVTATGGDVLFASLGGTDGQAVDNQRRELEAAATRHGWRIIAEYVDLGISGAKDRHGRPGLNGLLNGIARREFDTIAAWSVDRLGRSLQDLVTLLGEVHAKSVDLYLHQQGIDTTTPAGKALFQMMGVFAEFERAMIRERVNAGLARARASGKRLGRPRVGDAIEAEMRAALMSGKGMRKIARELKVGTSTVQRAKAIATA
jgi:DNA invertase Pin-like site-specific DNA recombinase